MYYMRFEKNKDVMIPSSIIYIDDYYASWYLRKGTYIYKNFYSYPQKEVDMRDLYTKNIIELDSSIEYTVACLLNEFDLTPEKERYYMNLYVLYNENR